MTNETVGVPLRALVGQNVRRLRLETGTTAEQLAQALRALGLNWNASRVSEFERGQKPAGVAELVLLASALSRGLPADGQVSLPEFFRGAESVQLTDAVTVSAQELLMMFAGGKPAAPMSDREPEDVLAGAAMNQVAGLRADLRFFLEEVEPEIAAQVLMTAGGADRKAAQSLGVPYGLFLSACAALWRTSLTGKRNSVQGDSGSKQARGHVTRTLLEQAAAYIDAQFQHPSDYVAENMRQMGFPEPVLGVTNSVPVIRQVDVIPARNQASEQPKK